MRGGGGCVAVRGWGVRVAVRGGGGCAAVRGGGGGVGFDSLRKLSNHMINSIIILF